MAAAMVGMGDTAGQGTKPCGAGISARECLRLRVGIRKRGRDEIAAFFILFVGRGTKVAPLDGRGGRRDMVRCYALTIGATDRLGSISPIRRICAPTPFNFSSMCS